jgi:hypothetical protein
MMALEDALFSYQYFLKTVLVPGIGVVYPTPSVDLVWHTHQLLGPEYRYAICAAARQHAMHFLTHLSSTWLLRDHTLDMVGVFVDHLSMEQIQPTSCELMFVLQ